MKILAQSGDWYVIEVRPQMGRIFDAARERLFPPMSLTAIMARGGWDPFTGDPQPVEQALSVAHDLAPDRAQQDTLLEHRERAL